MKNYKELLSLFIIVVMALMLFSCAKKAEKAMVTEMEAPAKEGTEIGYLAPNFEVAATNGGNIRLSDLKGSWVVLCFYPKSFSGA